MGTWVVRGKRGDFATSFEYLQKFLADDPGGSWVTEREGRAQRFETKKAAEEAAERAFCSEWSWWGVEAIDTRTLYEKLADIGDEK